MQIPTGFAQVNFRFTGSNLPQGAEMTLGVDLDLLGGQTPTDIGELVRDEWVAANIDSCYLNTMTMSSVLVKFGPNATGPSAVVSATAVGTATGESVPPNVAGLIRKNTGFGGRTGRGRMYLPGLPDNQVQEDGDLTPTWLTSLETVFGDFYVNLLAANCPPVLLHAPGSPVGAPMPLTGFTVDPKVATQRGRLR